MKILYIHQHFSTPAGFTGTRSYEFAKAMVRSGHEVTVLTGSPQMGKTGLTSGFIKGRRSGTVDGIQVVELSLTYSNYDSLPRRAMSFLKFSIKTLMIILKSKYDVLYATTTPLTVVIPLLASKIAKRRIPVIFEVRDLWPELPKAMGVIKNPLVLFLMAGLERAGYYAANYGVGLSPGICEGMQKYGSLSASKIKLIPNGSDIEFFQSVTRKDADAIPESLQELLNSKFTAVFPGAHGMANGLDAALDAAKILVQRSNHKIAFVFIGDGKVKPHLMRRAKDEGLYNCFFFDPIPKTALRWVLKQANVGLMLLQNVKAFYYGTSPNKFFDFLAAGLPVLNNYPGWVADLIQENQCGATVSPDSPHELADALEKLSGLSASDEADLGANALILAKRQFDRSFLSSQVVQLCEQALKG